MKWTALFRSGGRLGWLAVIAVAFLGGAGGLTSPAGAQGTNSQFAVIDVQRILREAKASKSVAPQMEKLRKSYQGAVRKREAELRKTSEDLQRQRAILAPEAFAKKRREYETQARAVIDERLDGQVETLEHDLLQRVRRAHHAARRV